MTGDLSALRPAYLTVQEGGSSAEIYINVADSQAEAEDFRKSCAQAAYRTSAPIEVPADLAVLGEPLWSLIEDILRASLNFEYVESEDEE